ncbi:MAG: MFS transporter [Chloroflexi bacterium]|nr:MFS transporter [Chloroflexota bacterium]MBT5627854.1 MFS transporter [Chloroflexota bacterium]
MTTPAHTNQPEFRRWRNRVLFSYSAFYLFVYMGRFNHWPAGPVMREQLDFSHVELGIINACLLWGFALGGMTHGRIAETYGYRFWLVAGTLASVALNWVTSFGTGLWTIAIPWGLNGFANATVWAPGIGMLAQWWHRSQRGRVMGLVGVAAGSAMLMMWLITGWTVAEFGWRAAFRYPPLLMIPAAVALFFLVRDRPSDVKLENLDQRGTMHSSATSLPDREGSREGDLGPKDESPPGPSRLTESRARLTKEDAPHGPFTAYKILYTNWRFVATSHVKGLENVVRYGLTTWAPLYYFEEAGLSIETTALVTVALPVGYLTAPMVSGWISDVLLNGRRSPMIAASALISAAALIGLAIVPAENVYAGAGLLFIGAFAMSLSMTSTLVVDMAGPRYAATASGILDGHGYVYAGAQAIIFALVLDTTGAPWHLVFLGMAGARILSALIAWRVKF